MRIILIRHGQSTGNTERRFQGQSKDPRFHLTELWKQQANKLKQRFIDENVSPTHIYSSPLKRVKETAEIISDPGANTSTLLPILVKADLYSSTNVPTDPTQITPGAAPGLDP